MGRLLRSPLLDAPLLRRVAWLGLAVLALVAILEIGFRAYFKDHYGGHGPGGEEVWVEKFGNPNSLGHRDHEFGVPKPPGVFRILTIGDANTYGEGVESIDDLYTEVLEKMLNATPALAQERGSRTYEVLNVSEIGWEVDDYLFAMRDPGLSYEPDLIIIGLYINDIEDRSYPRPIVRTLPQKIVRSWWRLSVLLDTHSYLYWYTVTPHAQWKYKEFWFDFVSGYVDPESHHWTRFADFYERIFQLGREENVPIVVAVIPYLVELNQSHPFISTYDRVATMASDNGATAVNFFPIFEQYDVSKLRAGLTRWVPSEEAHAIIAEELYKSIKAHGLVSLPTQDPN
jgi:lysophospholipase L1-like esterase